MKNYRENSGLTSSQLEPIYQSVKFLEDLHGKSITHNIDIKKLQNDSKEVESLHKKLKEAISQSQGQMIREEASLYGDFFKKESEKNTCWAWIYFVTTVLVAVATIILTYYTFKVDPNITANNISELIIKGNVLNKIFVFSIMALVITLFRREYLALRHQATLNTHRHNSIKSHKEILSSVEKNSKRF